MEKEALSILWEGFIKSLKHRTTSAHLITYFQGSAPESVDLSGVLTINVPNAFIKETLVQKYGDDILAFFNAADPAIKKLNLKTHTLKKEDSVDVSSILKNPKSEKTDVGVLNIETSAKNSLDNFIVGDNSQLAYAACKAIVKSPGSKYNPLFIYGGVGLGKTHLLQGVANELTRKYPDFHVVYTTAENLTNNLIDAITRKNIKKFRYKYRDSIDALIIDDIQFIEGKEKTQEEMFHTFNVLYEANKQIILSSDKSPIQLKTLEERLRSRFASGMVADITKPDTETRIAILRSKLQQRGYLVSFDVLNYIAEMIDTNIRELEGVLGQVVHEAELLQQDLSLGLVQRVVKRLYPAKIKKQSRPTPIINKDDILNTVAEYYNITPQEIIGTSRIQKTSTARHVCMYLLREILNMSLESVGEVFGNRNHTTVLHAVVKTKHNIKNDLKILKAVNQIKRNLGF